MAQVIQNLGALSGAATGLGAGLQELAKRKIGELQQRERRSELAQALENYGYSPEQAQLYSLAGEKNLPTILQQKPFGGALRELSPQQQNITQEEPYKFQPLDAESLIQQSEAAGRKLTTAEQEKIRIKAAEINASEPLQRQFENFMQSQQLKQQTPIESPSAQTAISQQPTISAVAPTKKETPPAFRDVKAEALSRKEALEEKKAAERDQNKIDKSTEKYVNDVQNAAEASKQADVRLGRMENLIKKGKLPMPGPRAFVNAVLHRVPFLKLPEDFDLSELGNPDAAEFISLRNAFLKDAKTIFGARLTNFDVTQFLKMIPDLAQSDEGKLRLIYDWKILNEAARIKNKAMQDIIKENKGKRPGDLVNLVDQRTKKDMDRLAAQFKAGLEGPSSALL